MALVEREKRIGFRLDGARSDDGIVRLPTRDPVIRRTT